MTISWPDELELTLTGIAQGGDAVGRRDDRVVFASGGIPGERVRVHLDERREAFARGRVVAVLEASPDRVAPRLPGAGHIPWQHIAYEAQLRFRREILRDQLARIGGLDAVLIPPTIPASRPWAYRNAIRLHSDGRQLGYHVPGAREIDPIIVDPLVLPVLNDAIAALLVALKRVPPDVPFEVSLRASESDGYVLAVLTSPMRTIDARNNLDTLAYRWRMECPALAGVLAPGEISGADRLVEEMGGQTFLLHPTTFFQVNTRAAEALLQLVLEGLELRGHERVLDLFCGAGTFALPLARRCAEVVGIEEYEGAVEDALASAMANGQDRAKFIVGPVERALVRIDSAFDGVVLDPPRRGCHPQALYELLRLAPPRIVYVACHPATLARDLKLLSADYLVEQVTPVDLFPQTAHVESVTVLRHRR